MQLLTECSKDELQEIKDLLSQSFRLHFLQINSPKVISTLA